MQGKEGQPQLRLIQPLKRVVDRVTRKGEKVSAPRTPTLLDNPVLAQVYNESIKAYDEHLDRIVAEYQERRAKEPKTSPYEIVDGKKVTFLEQFTALLDTWERLEQEAAARGDTEIDYSQLPWRPQPRRYEDLTPEQRSFQNVTVARKLNNHMVKEAHDAQFDRVAELIQERVWKDKSFLSPAVTINPSEELKLRIKKDGSIINRSRFGTTISYTHKDIETSKHNDKIVHIPQKEELVFGIGYFGDRADIIPEAQGFVSDEELAEGVKAYYVQRNYTVEEYGKIVRKTELTVIPIAYSNSMHTFCEQLYVNAKLVSPEMVIPQAKQRMKASRRNRHYAATA